MKRLRLAAVGLAAVGLVVGLTACDDGKPPQVSGSVQEKKYIPEKSWTEYVPMVTGKTSVVMPVDHHEPACFQIKVEDKKLCVDNATYESLNVGSFYTNIEDSDE